MRDSSSTTTATSFMDSDPTARRTATDIFMWLPVSTTSPCISSTRPHSRKSPARRSSQWVTAVRAHTCTISATTIIFMPHTVAQKDHRPSSAQPIRWDLTRSTTAGFSPTSESTRAESFRRRQESGGPFSSRMPEPSDVSRIWSQSHGRTDGLQSAMPEGMSASREKPTRNPMSARLIQRLISLPTTRSPMQSSGCSGSGTTTPTTTRGHSSKIRVISGSIPSPSPTTSSRHATCSHSVSSAIIKLAHKAVSMPTATERCPSTRRECRRATSQDSVSSRTLTAISQ